MTSIHSAAVSAPDSIRVAPGDSLWSLARKHGVTIAALQAANQMGASEQIRAGQTLRLPSVAASNAEAPARESTPVAAPKASLPRPETAKPETAKPLSASVRDEAERLYSKETAPPTVNTLAEHVPAWVLAEPPPETQAEKPAAVRGLFPCAAPDPGFAHYAKWVQVAPMAHVLAPPASTPLRPVGPDGGFDVVFHFHGREPLRKEWVRAMEGAQADAVLVSVDIGIASEAYRETFRDPRTFSQVLLAVEAELQRRSGNPQAHARNIALSSWSAGYGAIEQLLTQPIPRARVGSVVLLDGLHAGFRDASLNEERMAPFVEFAEQAAAGNRFMFVSHSSIQTRGYASTTQTARYLVWKVGGRPQASATTPIDPMGLDRYTTYTQGNFHVRGFKGNGALDHCAHLGLMRDVLRVHLMPLWQRSRDVEAPQAQRRNDGAPRSLSRGPNSADEMPGETRTPQEG